LRANQTASTPACLQLRFHTGTRISGILAHRVHALPTDAAVLEDRVDELLEEGLRVVSVEDRKPIYDEIQEIDAMLLRRM
jgi:hypothetical protein